MKRFLVGAVLAVLLVLGIQTGASAHGTTATGSTECVAGKPVAVVKFTNDFSVPVTITVFDTEVVVPPATNDGLGEATATGDYQSGSNSYTAVWTDGYYTEGTFELPVLIDGCVALELPPVSTIPVPTPATPTDSNTNTSTSVPVDITEQVEDQSTPECTTSSSTTTCLAFTGTAQSVGMTKIGGALIGLGVFAMMWARAARKREAWEQKKISSLS